MATIVGGDKLTAALNDIAKNLDKASSVEIGFLEGAPYPDGTSVPLVAAVQEFGAPSRGIPPRPFFRGMVAAKSGEWPRAIAAFLKANNYDAEKTLLQTGATIKGQLQDAIVEFQGVPLKPATVKRKGFDKQLIDTGYMKASVDYRVK